METSATVARVEPLLRLAIDRAIELGYCLKRGVTVNEENKTCCALGACIVAGSYRLSILLEVLNVDFDWARSFMIGFDGYPKTAFDNSDAFEFGQRLAEEFLTERKET